MELTEFELQQVHAFVKRLKQHVGKAQAVYIEDIRMSYRNQGINLSYARIQAIIHHIRMNETIQIGTRKYFILSDQGNFWLSCEKDEVTKFSKSLEERAQELLAVKSTADRYLNIKPKEEKQPALFK